MLPKLIIYNTYFVVGSSDNKESSRDDKTAERAKKSGVFTYALLSIVSKTLNALYKLIHY